MLLVFFHLDHGWRKRGWKPYLGQSKPSTCKFFKCWNDIWDEKINSRSMSVYKTFGQIDALVFWNPLTKPHCQTSKQLNQNKFFKCYILKFKTTRDEEIANTKVPKLEIKTIRRCGLINQLWKHSMLFLNKKNIKLFNELPKTRIWHSRSSFVTCNFHTTILNIDKNVERDHWGDNGFNKPLVLPFFD